MKTWLAKFRISTALDRGEGLRASSADGRLSSPEVRRFEASLRALDTRLRAGRPPVTAPDGLHASIMRAVRAEASASRDARQALLWRWLPVPVTALALGLGVWWFGSRIPSTLEPAAAQPLVAAAAALEQSHQWTERAPGAALAPLTQELESLRRDVRGAMAFLMASVP